jgi:FKBP-type peptidyl-prolyl cis-trans isomerase (trigger factor)
MEIIVTNIDEQQKLLEITTPWNVVEEEYNDILKRYSKLSFKGFRPGKAPVGAIESFFKSQIKNDLMSTVSTRLCRNALKEKDLVAGTPIEISEVELSKNNHLKFGASFIEMPRFELPDYSSMNLESEQTEDKLDEISVKLLEQTTIDIHPVFTDNELKFSENPDDQSDENRQAAEERVKLMLILKKIAHQDNVEIDDKDIDDRIKDIARENDVSYDELKEFLIMNNGLSRLADSLLAEQVLQYIIDIQPENK